MGCHFLFGYNHDYNIENGEIILAQQHPKKKIGCQRSEKERSAEMAIELRSALGDGYYITCLGRESNHLCPFSGGGDLNIFKGGECYAAATIFQSGVDDADTDGAEPNPERLCHSPASGTPRPQVSPPKQGEYHCVTIENKLARTCNALLQLQANMVVLCSRLLLNLMESLSFSHDQIRAVKVLSCYGILLGVDYDLKILKLTMDFEKESLNFEELFSYGPSVYYGMFIDMCIYNVIRSL